MNMRQIFRNNIMTSEKKTKDNDKPKNKNNFLRPKTALQKKEGPIKLLNKKTANSKAGFNNTNSYLGKNTNLNTYYYSSNYNSENEDNILSNEENYIKTNPKVLSSFSNTEPNIFRKRAKTATDRFKIKLENITNMFKNEPKNYLSSQQKLIFKHRGLIPGIPKDLLPRLKLVFNIFKNPTFIKYVKKAPSKRQKALEEITDYLWEYNSDHTHILDFYAIFFYYLCTNIQYDIKEINKNEKDLNNIFKSGFANSLQFCRLYEFMCKKNLLRIKRIEGFCKSKELPYYKRGSDVTKINHYWNAIYINKEWYFCDLTFGSGGIKPRNEYHHNYFNPYYFITPADNLIETHRPIDDMWQMTSKIIPAKQFSYTKEINISDFYKKVYEYSINLVSHKYPIIKCDNTKPIFIEIGVKEMAIQAYLYYSNFKDKVSEVKFGFNTEENIFTLEPVFPSNGEYWLEILFREFSSNEVQYLPLINYKIIVSDSQEQYIKNLKKKCSNSQKQKIIKELNLKKRPKSKSIRIPNISKVLISRDKIKFKKDTIICLDNEGAHLISPSGNNIKIGQINDFKVKVPNSEAVCVLDGHEWNYLKRNKKDKNFWYGSFEIKNENISILSMKENKLFTEVFQLKGHYATSNLLRLSQQKKDHFRSMKNIKNIKNKKMSNI